jgi:hypothetical protein
MKNLVCLLLFVTTSVANVFAQEVSHSFTYAELRSGYGLSFFGQGLKERYNAGNFSSSGGGLVSLAAYHKFKKINALNFGIKYKSLAAAPASGDNGQEMFFNYWGAAITIKYFPFDKNAKKGLYVQGDYFFATQFTQKYRSVSALQFDHQFAIGSGFAVGLGYDIPLRNKKTMLTLGFEYEYDSRQGEVTGIGDKTFVSSNAGIMVGLKF